MCSLSWRGGPVLPVSQSLQTFARGRRMACRDSIARPLLLANTVPVNAYILTSHYQPKRWLTSIKHQVPITRPAYSRAKLQDMLRIGNPDQLLHSITRFDYRGIVEAMPDSMFVSVLLRITPEHFINPFVEILRPVDSWVLLKHNHHDMGNIVKRFSTALSKLLNMRRRTQRNNKQNISVFGITEYRHLLRLAAAIGSLETAEAIFQEMRYNGVKPDLQCYNWYLHACVWNHSIYGLERKRLRVTPFYYRARGLPAPTVGYRGFGTAGRSVRSHVYSTILEMREANLVPDQDTCIAMLLASARVGSREGMNRVLYDVWNIDVEAVTTMAPEDRPAAKKLPRSSPLYPTTKLLIAVAHGYGCNNRFNESVEIVTYISDQYGVEITRDVWKELFNSAYILSRNHSRHNPANLGYIPMSKLFDIKERMEIDGIAFDMEMYRKLAISAWRTQQFDVYQQLTRDAYELLCKTRGERHHALKVLECFWNVPLRNPSSVPIAHERPFIFSSQSPQAWKVVRSYAMTRMLAEQQQFLFKQIVRIGILGQTSENRVTWTQQLLPKHIAEWRDFFPKSFTVALGNGAGTMEVFTKPTSSEANMRMRMDYYEPLRWSKCGDDTLMEEKGQQQIFEFSHNFVWSHLKVSLGILASLSVFRWFFGKRWGRLRRLSPRPATVRRLSYFPELSLDQMIENRKNKHGYYVTMEPLFNIPIK